MWKRPQQRSCEMTSDWWQFMWGLLTETVHCLVLHCVRTMFTMLNFAGTNERCSAKGGYMRAAVKSISPASMSRCISRCSFSPHEWLHAASSPIRSNNIDNCEASLAACESNRATVKLILASESLVHLLNEFLLQLLDVSFAFPAATCNNTGSGFGRNWKQI